MSSTNIHDDEVLKMAAFKLSETARRVAMLAKEAETPELRRLLLAASAGLNQQARDLRASVGKLDHEVPAAAAAPERAIPTGRGSRQNLRLAGARGPRLVARG
jgi:hypothetical protein